MNAPVWLKSQLPDWHWTFKLNVKGSVGSGPVTAYTPFTQKRLSDSETICMDTQPWFSTILSGVVAFAES